MSDLNQIEKSILLDIRDMAVYEASDYIVDLSNYNLKEIDPIKKIQELVFYIERIEGVGLIKTEEGFYKESDKISFEYMNSATEVYFDKLSLTDIGVIWIEENEFSFIEKVIKKCKIAGKLYFSNYKYILFSYLLIFILGLISGIILS